MVDSSKPPVNDALKGIVAEEYIPDASGSSRLLPNGRPVARGAQGKSMGDQISVQGARAGA